MPSASDDGSNSWAEESPLAAGEQALRRFLDAQEPVYDQVRLELSSGSKVSHWMWFVFPQMRYLGRSATARHFGITDRAEALAYWRHPVLGSRLRECIDLMLAVRGKTAHQILGSPDDIKFRSCLTLFDAVAPDDDRCARALDRFYGGERDALTLQGL